MSYWQEITAASAIAILCALGLGAVFGRISDVNILVPLIVGTLAGVLISRSLR